MRKATVSRMRERDAQKVLTFRVTYLCSTPFVLEVDELKVFHKKMKEIILTSKK